MSEQRDLTRVADMTEEPQARGSSLSNEQITYLIESGSFTAEELAEAQARIARGELAEAERRTQLAAIRASLSAAEVAAQLGVDVDEVDRLRDAGNLFAFAADGELRYPTWQFTGDLRRPVLPGLALLVSAFPDDMHPASVRGFMSTPQSSARIDGVAVTPVAWLQHGGDPQLLTDIIDSFLMS